MPKIAVRLAVNPADTDQRYVLWSNGVIDAFGGAPPIPSSPDSNYSAGTAPIIGDAFVEEHVVVAFVITDWATPSGYVLDKYGRVYAFGSATAVAAGQQPVAGTYPDSGYRDFVMDPSATGQGYALNLNGNVPNIGGSVVIGGQTDFLDSDVASRIVMPVWSTKKYAVMDYLGRRYSRHGAIALDAFYQQPDAVQSFTQDTPLYNGYIGVSLKLIENLESGNGDGWILGSFGWIHSVENAQLVSGNPVFEGRSIFTDLGVIDDGTGAGPLTLAVLSIYGGIHEFVVSTPPTRAVLGPKDPTTNTTQPVVTWSYGDSEGDAQDAYVVRVFTQAQYTAGGFDPAADDADVFFEAVGAGPLVRNVRSVQIDKDVPNTSYRAYVWVKDTSNLWAAGNVYKQWAQTVTLPATPTLTITEGTPLTGHLLAVDVPAVDVVVSAHYVVEYRDGAAMPWQYVTGGDALIPDGAGHAQVRDREPPLNVPRFYRARQLIPDPILAGAWTIEQSVTMLGEVETLIDVHSTLGLEVIVRAFKADEHVEGVLTAYPDGRRKAVVVSGPVPVKGDDFDLELRTLNAADYSVLRQMYRSGHVLLYRDAYGNTSYLRVNDSVSRELIPAAKQAGEPSRLRHHHEFTIPVVEVSRPFVGPETGPLALRDEALTVA